MADNVQVALRVRPLVSSELRNGSKDILEIYNDLCQVRVNQRPFTYNYVFGPDTDQASVYNGSVRPMVENIFKGYNLTILAYGQTGSGKTYSMGTAYNGQGDSHELGIIPRAVNDIFSYIKDNFSYTFNVTVSFMELYQEVLYDLLVDKPRDQCILDIREDKSGIIIPGLSEIIVTNPMEVFAVLAKGSTGRVTGSTNMNAESSRSHAIFSMNFCMTSKADSNENKMARFHLVDLAGSERQKKTGAVGNTFREGININKGLLVLGNVISALGDKLAHIPYRDSQLTRLLKDSLGGNSITLMIACVSPADYNMEETMSTLRYADRARKIQNRPVVNQDQKAAEILQLKRTIQQLQLQIVGQGGPGLCPGEMELLKKEVLDLKTKNRSLTFQLSSTLNANTDLLEKNMLLQNTNEVLKTKICQLKDNYDNTLNNISAGLDVNDQDSMRNNITLLQRIQEQMQDINTVQKNAESEMLKHQQALDAQHENNGDENCDHEDYAKEQMKLTSEYQEISKKLAVKEQLAKQMAINNQYMVDYDNLAENEAKIQQLQRERDELLKQVKTTGSGLAEQRRKRVQELESQIQELNKKVQHQARLIKMKEKDEVKIKKLNAEITDIKRTRVKLIRNMREASENFRVWKMQREKDIARLKELDRKKQHQIVVMERMHSKQQNVLKRKVEEAVALNKRLKDALALKKTIGSAKTSSINERIGNLVKHEFDLRLHVFEAETMLKSLLEDRASIQHQLDNLKLNNGDPAEIRAMEEDLELRSVQIQDMQQKVLDSSDDKSKHCFENIQTMGDAKYAMKVIMERAMALKKEQLGTASKLTEVEVNAVELNEKLAHLEKQRIAMESELHNELSRQHREYEEKVAVLLRQLRGVEVEGMEEELRQRFSIQTERIAELDKQNQELLAKVYDLQKENETLAAKLETVGKMASNSRFADNSRLTDHNRLVADQDNFKTPPPRNRMKIKQELDSTFTLENTHKVDLDSSAEDAFQEDNIEKDPDWRRTPVGKWINDRKKSRNVSTAVVADATASQACKRTSEGGCNCAKGNCKRCSCKKLNRACNSSCKCQAVICENRRSTSEGVDENEVPEKKSSDVGRRRTHSVLDLLAFDSMAMGL